MTAPNRRGRRTPRDSQELQQILHHCVPITAWLPAYPRDLFRNDMIAGVTNWGVMVPVAMAYAQIAGVPAQVGLYTAFAALLGYAIFGTSRQLKVTTSSTMAVMSAAVVGAMAQGDVGRYMALSSALAFTIGIILLAAGRDVLLAQVRGSVRDRLRHSGVMAEIGEDRVYRSVATAIYDFERREGLSET